MRVDLPHHLEQYVAHQDPSLYTPMDHAGWRYIMKVSRTFFAKHAHPMYLEGLEKTGISSDRIPLISEMDEKLRRFNWRAVPVCGFIPPSVFMEFLSLGILPIACDMRRLEHLAYTPAPDIVHEAAGHAPIIADPEYAQYLRQYGEISRKAIHSTQDWSVYMAIRELSDIKENPRSSTRQIQSAQEKLNATLAAVDHVSEATQLARMSWWTIEYGLIGEQSQPKIYGAGLLSSIGESYHCLSSRVQKLPLTLSCIEASYDITRPQPQLYIARDFEALTEVLHELSETMAYRRGGIMGLTKAKKAASTTTTVLNSGLQIGGVVHTIIAEATNDLTPAYLRFHGPVQFAFGDKELEEYGVAKKNHHFETPLGDLKDLGKSLADLSDTELRRMGSRFEFASGITLEGRLKNKIARGGRNLLLVFEDCTVQLGHETLHRFTPETNEYIVACGSQVISVFGGAADRSAYYAKTGGVGQVPGQPKTNLTDENRDLNRLYLQVRGIREDREFANSPDALGAFARIHDQLDQHYPKDWLLRYELLELIKSHDHGADKQGSDLERSLRGRLSEIAKNLPETTEMIQRGLDFL